jgi:hypothetical protein
MQDWHAEIKEDMKKAFVKIVEDIQAHVKQLAISERAMLLLVRARFPRSNLKSSPYLAQGLFSNTVRTR